MTPAAITQPKAPPEAEEGAEAQAPKMATVEVDIKAVVADLRAVAADTDQRSMTPTSSAAWSTAMEPCLTLHTPTLTQPPWLWMSGTLQQLGKNARW